MRFEVCEIFFNCVLVLGENPVKSDMKTFLYFLVFIIPHSYFHFHPFLKFLSMRKEAMVKGR